MAGFFEKEIKEEGLPMVETELNPEAPRPREMIDLEATFEQLESELKEINGNMEQLDRSALELTELRHILTKTGTLFDEVRLPSSLFLPFPGTAPFRGGCSTRTRRPWRPSRSPRGRRPPGRPPRTRKPPSTRPPPPSSRTPPSSPAPRKGLKGEI